MRLQACRPRESSGYPRPAEIVFVVLAWQFRTPPYGPLPGAHRDMTSGTEQLRLAADFAPANEDDWRRLVDGALKGAPFERLVARSYDGLEIQPIYPRARDARPVCGRAPAQPWR